MNRGQEDQKFWPKYFASISQNWSALYSFVKPILLCHCVPKYLEFLTVQRTYLLCFIATLYCIPVIRHGVEVFPFNMLRKCRQFLGKHFTLGAKVLKKELLLPASPQNQYPLGRGWLCSRVGLVELKEWQKSIYNSIYKLIYKSRQFWKSQAARPKQRLVKITGGSESTYLDHFRIHSQSSTFASQ